MKKFAFAILVSLVTLSAFGQSGTLAAAVTPPTQTSIVVGNVTEHRADPNITGDIATASVELWLLTGGGVKADTYTVFMNGNTEVNALETARSATATNETGSGARIENFRVLTYLKANCTTFQRPCAAWVAGITLVP